MAATGSPRERLTVYLKKELPDLSDPVKFGDIEGSHFCRMQLVTAGDRQLVVKQQPPNMPQTPYTVAREFEMLNRWGKAVAFAPKPVLFCADPDVLGSPFMVMERMDGVHESLPNSEQFGAMVDVLADLHDVDLEKHGLSDIGKPRGFRPRLFGVWQEQMAAARTEGMPDFAPVIAAIERLMPPEGDRIGATHNRALIENFLWRPNNRNRLKGLLDWRNVSTGDSIMDLSQLLGYWIETDDVPSLRLLGTVPDRFTRAEAIARYEERRKIKVEHVPFYLAMGFFRRAVETQKRYFEYRKGFAHDDVMVRLRESIKGLHEMARKAAG